MSVRDALTFEGLEEAERKVLDWLKKAADSLETEGELHVTLSQASKNGSADVYDTVYAFDETLEELVAELMTAAQDDAEHIGRGKVKYTVAVDKVKGRATFSLKIVGGDDDDLDDIDEPATKRGLIGQQMAHNEAFARLSLDATKDILAVLRQELKDARYRIAMLERERVDQYKAYEELLSMKQVRDLEFRKLENSERRKDQVSHIVMQGLPILASKLLGGGMKQAVEMAGAKTPLEQMLEAFIMTFDQQQLVAIMNSEVFSMPQKAALHEMLMFIMQRHEADQARARGETPPQQHTNGAAQAPQQEAPTPQ